MITKDLPPYANAHWKEKYLKPVSELSASDNGEPLVQSQVKMFGFDGIVNDLFVGKEKPKTADALYFRYGKNKALYLIEFKRGLFSLLTKENRTKDEAKKADEKFEEMKSSVRMKALESYVTLERAFFPFCKDAVDNGTRLFFWLVIDSGPISGMEHMLSLKKFPKPPPQIGDALRRFQQSMTVDGNSKPYIYDCIEVMYASEFDRRMSKATLKRKGAE